MLQFAGDKELSQSQSVLWSKLSDARFLVECIPGVEATAFAEQGKAVCTLRPGFAFVRGTLELTLIVADTVAEQSIRLLLHGKGIGSTNDVEATLNLEPQSNGTRVHWVAEIKSLGGLLKAVPPGLIKAAAQKVIADALAAIEAKLQEV